MTVTRVYVYGYYGHGNFGDDLLASVVNDQLILKGVGEKWFKNGESLPFFDSSALKSFNEPSFNSSRCYVIEVVRYGFVFIKEYWLLFRKIDCLMFGGGTLLTAPVNTRTLIQIAILTLMAKLSGLKIIGVGIGIGILNGKFSIYLAKKILNMFDFIGVRDFESYKITQMFDVKRARKTSDLAFISNFETLQHSLDGALLVAGITFAPLQLKMFNEEEKEKIKKTFVKVIEQLLISDYTVKLGVFQDIDLEFYKETLPLEVISNEKLNIEKISYSKRMDTSFYGNCDFILGSRFHSLVLAAIYKVPFVGFSNDHKVSELCKTFGMPYFTFESFNENILELDSLINRRVFHFDKILREQKALALKNFGFDCD
jgi:polysaccharide pyruvyl transferase WcaK-like protein